MEANVAVPEDVSVQIEDSTVKLERKEAVVERTFDYPLVSVREENGLLVIESESDGKEERAIVNTYKSHIENMIAGITGRFVYNMKAVYAHFPMQISVEDDTFVVQNFLGERAPRTVEIMDGVTVEVDGEDVYVKGHDIEAVGTMAARIERLCSEKKKDRRKFQDGIYLVERSVEGEQDG